MFLEGRVSRRICYTLLANHRSIETKLRNDPTKIGLFPINRKVRLIKEDETTVRLFLSIISF